MKYRKEIAGLLTAAMIVSLSGCSGGETKENDVKETLVQTEETATEKETITEVTKTGETENDTIVEMETEENSDVAQAVINNEVQTNSISMLNFLTVLAEEVHQSSNSRIFLEGVTDSLLNDLYPNAIDKRTQTYITDMLRNINDLRMIDVKRERLAFIYEQNKAMAMKSAMPSPLSLLNVVKSTNPLQAIASVTYLAVDAYTSYSSATTAAELSYLKDGWVLNDAEDETINENRIEAFNYMHDIIRDNGLDGDLALNETAVQRFVEWKNDQNIVSRIQHLESEQKTYAAYGDYWILLAKSYYENENYSECIAAVETYLRTQPRIFRKDTELATIMPFAIASLEEVLKGDALIEKEVEFVELLDLNADNTNWELKYFAALTYMDLYSKTDDEAYLQEAYRIIKDNVNELYKKQLKMNREYLAEVAPEEIPVESTKNEKEEIEQYNKMLKEVRKTELPPVDNALLLNLQVLFGLGEKISISEDEESRVEAILHQNGEHLFLNYVLDNQFRYGEEDQFEIDGSFQGRVLTIPVILVNDNSKIVVTHRGEETTVYEDWSVSSVERPKESTAVEDFKAVYKSETIDDAPIQDGDTVLVQVYPYGDEFEPIELEFVAHENKLITFRTGFDYELLK